MSNIQIGDIVKNDTGVREVPAGTKLVKVGTTEIKTREVHGGRWFVEGGSGWGNEEWVVVALAEVPAAPPVPKPDLTDKGVLALELYRVRTDDPTRTDLPGHSADLWLKAAEFVLSNFQVKSARNAKVGDKVKVANGGNQGETGIVRETIDSDGELYIEFYYTTTYVHHSALELV